MTRPGTEGYKAQGGNLTLSNAPELVPGMDYTFTALEDPVRTSRADIYSLLGPEDKAYRAKLYQPRRTDAAELVLAPERMLLYMHYMGNVAISPEVYRAIMEVTHLPEAQDRTFAACVADPKSFFDHTDTFDATRKYAVMMKELAAARNAENALERAQNVREISEVALATTRAVAAFHNDFPAYLSFADVEDYADIQHYKHYVYNVKMIDGLERFFQNKIDQSFAGSTPYLAGGDRARLQAVINFRKNMDVLFSAFNMWPCTMSPQPAGKKFLRILEARHAEGRGGYGHGDLKLEHIFFGTDSEKGELIDSPAITSFCEQDGIFDFSLTLVDLEWQLLKRYYAEQPSEEGTASGLTPKNISELLAQARSEYLRLTDTPKDSSSDFLYIVGLAYKAFTQLAIDIVYDHKSDFDGIKMELFKKYAYYLDLLIQFPKHMRLR